MNQGKYVFSQIVTFLPARIFDRCVSSFQGDKWVKHFYLLESVNVHDVWSIKQP
jgi:hypothetical protein